MRQGSLLRVGEVQFDRNQRIAVRKANANLRAARNTKTSNFSKIVARNLIAVDEVNILATDVQPEKSGETANDSLHQNAFFNKHVQWISDYLKIHRESEFTLSLIFILSGAISFAVGILLALHTYLGSPGNVIVLTYPVFSAFKMSSAAVFTYPSKFNVIISFQ